VPVAPGDVEAASERTGPYVRSTPVLGVEPEALDTSGHIVVKLEQLQHTGSFKPRGAFNRILTSKVPRAGVVAASGGNFGAAVAYAAGVLGHRAEVFVPESTPTAKVDRLRSSGCSVVVTGAFCSSAVPFGPNRANASVCCCAGPTSTPAASTHSPRERQTCVHGRLLRLAKRASRRRSRRLGPCCAGAAGDSGIEPEEGRRRIAAGAALVGLSPRVECPHAVARPRE
jgi:hypothetical protein